MYVGSSTYCSTGGNVVVIGAIERSLHEGAVYHPRKPEFLVPCGTLPDECCEWQVDR